MGGLLTRVYFETGKNVYRSMGYHSLVRLLETYLVYWLLRADKDSANNLMANRALLEQSVPHWGQVSSYIKGKVDDLQYRRRTAPADALREGSARDGHNAFSSSFSYEDAHSIVGGITKTFASFWDSECASMKAALFERDTQRTGRVPLSKFYGKGLDGDWRFGESEAYLRELGALDESSRHGKQVIVSNYMQAASNCVISTPHYLVCCTNDCEPLLAEIEVTIGAPRASPLALLAVVGSMAAQSTLDDDQPPRLAVTLLEMLERIAEAHGGEVPLYGRLFAQWLHYVFPRECAFPHQAGSVAAIPPSEYGEEFYASPEEMQRHANSSSLAFDYISKDGVQWMSQWIPEEELMAEHAADIQAPWEKRRPALGVVAATGAFTLFLVASLARLVQSIRGKRTEASMDLFAASKQHYV